MQSIQDEVVIASSDFTWIAVERLYAENRAGGLKVGGPCEALLPAGIDPLLELVDLFLGYGFETCPGI